jgi:hypothetical protein
VIRFLATIAKIISCLPHRPLGHDLIFIKPPWLHVVFGKHSWGGGTSKVDSSHLLAVLRRHLRLSPSQRQDPQDGCRDGRHAPLSKPHLVVWRGLRHQLVWQREHHLLLPYFLLRSPSSRYANDHGLMLATGSWIPPLSWTHSSNFPFSYGPIFSNFCSLFLHFRLGCC